MENGKNRSSFTGKLGFVLAAAGSAVGLGNLWRFPYLAAEYGGGIFLLTYIILAVTFGFALMVAEIAIGRKTGLSAVGAFSALNKKWSFLGVLASIVPMIILPYYSVIGGWVIKYLTVFVTGGGTDAAGDSFFGNFISQPFEPIVWLAIFVALTAVVVLLGVEKGIEKVSKIAMPILVLLSVGIAIYSVTLPGAWEGVKYYFIPDFSRFSPMVVLAALGQLFYSMSLAMGIMITYGSYMKREVHLPNAVHQIELFDTGIALIAGLMIVPPVFVFTNGDESQLQAGAGLMFQMLPKVFNNFPGGHIIGAVFFLLVLFAALTSSISLMETIVSILQDKLHWGRKKTCLLVAVGALLIALPSSLGYGLLSGFTLWGMSFLDLFDFISNSILMPIVALLTCIFVGYIIKPQVIVNEIRVSAEFKEEKFFTVLIKYVAPICIVGILVASVLDAFGIVRIFNP